MIACAEHRTRFCEVWYAAVAEVTGGRVIAEMLLMASKAVAWYAAMQFHMI